MKKIVYGICLIFCSFFSLAYAGGGITHMFIAQQVIAKVPDSQLRNVLLDNYDAYLVGAYYPDSGYIRGTGYGEDSHWDAFIFTFADYLREKYSDPVTQNPKLVAFLFGCAVHRLSDEIMHWTFYPVMADHDFQNAKDKTESYGDTGIDLLLNVDKSQWLAEPSTWWVPVSDLLQVYHRMGKDQYTANEITWGNSVLSVAGYGERLIALPAYPYLKWKMPWTAAHYYDWPVGGITMDEGKVLDYQMNLWQRLKFGKKFAFDAAPAARKNFAAEVQNNPVNDFADNALASGAISVTAKTNSDGSVELQQPIVNEVQKFRKLLSQLIAKITG